MTREQLCARAQLPCRAGSVQNSIWVSMVGGIASGGREVEKTRAGKPGKGSALRRGARNAATPCRSVSGPNGHRWLSSETPTLATPTKPPFTEITGDAGTFLDCDSARCEWFGLALRRSNARQHCEYTPVVVPSGDGSGPQERQLCTCFFVPGWGSSFDFIHGNEPQAQCKVPGPPYVPTTTTITTTHQKSSSGRTLGTHNLGLIGGIVLALWLDAAARR